MNDRLTPSFYKFCNRPVNRALPLTEGALVVMTHAIAQTEPAGASPVRNDPAILDRLADRLLQEGRHVQAERLSNLALELRQGGAA